MHAYLIAGEDFTELATKLSAKVLEFPLQKIEDTRELNKLLRLSFNEKTLIVIKDIHTATEEALNAFLKNLEEPQENIYFALTTPSISLVLPTIVSRCQIVKIQSTQSPVHSDFLNMNTVQRLDFVGKIKDRSEAINFVENLMYYLHEKRDLKNMELILKTHTRLGASGNVNLQLANLAIHYGNK